MSSKQVTLILFIIIIIMCGILGVAVVRTMKNQNRTPILNDDAYVKPRESRTPWPQSSTTMRWLYWTTPSGLGESPSEVCGTCDCVVHTPGSDTNGIEGNTVIMFQKPGADSVLSSPGNTIVLGEIAGKPLCTNKLHETCIVLPFGISVETESPDPQIVAWAHQIADSVHIGSNSCK